MAELARVVRSGGTMAAYVWPKLGGNHPLGPLRAAVAAVGGPPSSRPEGRIRTVPGLLDLFGDAGLEREFRNLGPGLSKMLFANCQRCRGSGRQRTVESRCEAILRRLGAALTLKGFTKVEVRSAPEVIDHLKAQYSAALKDLEGRSQRELVLISAPDQLEDNVLRYLRADGREVRPGGRRKR